MNIEDIAYMLVYAQTTCHEIVLICAYRGKTLYTRQGKNVCMKMYMYISYLIDCL